jgi:hypothetical protein
MHILLMKWAISCAEHVLPLCGDPADERLLHALVVAKQWTEGQASVGNARKASVECHKVARATTNPVAVAVAHAVGHAVANAHMAAHSLGPAWYGLRAVKSAGGSVEEERKWQDAQLPPEIRALVLSARKLRNV